MYRLPELIKAIEANRDSDPNAIIEIAIEGVCNAWKAEYALYNHLEQGYAEESAAAGEAEIAALGAASVAAHMRDDSTQDNDALSSAPEPDNAPDAAAAVVPLVAEDSLAQIADTQ